MVVHGCVDGYTRIPVYLKSSTNNKASTVLALFMKAVDDWGLLSRVRRDKGGENVDVTRYMLHHPIRGTDRGSAITGKSVHNSSVSTSVLQHFHAWRVFLSRRVDAAWNCYAILRVPHPPEYVDPPVRGPHDVADPVRDRT